MRTLESITQEIRAASDIVEVVSQFVALKPAGRDFKGRCPFHREKTPSFHVRPAEQYFKCFGCGKAGDVFTFLMELHSITFMEVRQMLADQARISIEVQAGQRSGGAGPSRQDLLKANEWAVGLFRKHLNGSAGQPVREYLAKRGISDEMVERFQLGFAPDSYDSLLAAASRAGIADRVLLAVGLVRERTNGGCYDMFRDRLMFPIIDPANRVVGFGGRALGDDPAKYINTPETALFHKSQCLYGLNLARKAFDERKRAVVVEGYTDVIKAHQNGFHETVAPLGTALTSRQSDILRRYVSRAIVVFDADPAGKKAADRAVEIALQAHLDVLLAVMPDGLDPFDFLSQKGAAKFEDLLISAMPALSFKWQSTLREHQGGGSPAAKLEAVRSFVEFIAFSDTFGGLDEIRRGQAIDQLAVILGVSRQAVGIQVKAAHQRLGTSRRPQTEGQADSDSQAGTKTPSRPRSAEQAAALEILISLVCEPGLFSRVAEMFEPHLLAEPQLQRIAEAVVRLAGEVGEYSINELMDLLESPSDGVRCVALFEAGRSAGRLDERLSAAVDRLKTAAVARRSSQAEREWYDERSGVSDAAGQVRDRNLSELSARTEQYGSAANFVGIRKLRLDTTQH